MLRIYSEYPTAVMDNDRFFAMHTYTLAKSDTPQGIALRTLAARIDGVSFINNSQFLSKFNSEIVLDLRYLSTGSKTAMNVLAFKDTVFSLIECGDNASLEILRLTDGNIVPRRIPASRDDFLWQKSFEYSKSGETCEVIIGLPALKEAIEDD